MKAKLISKTTTGFLIEVDDELMRKITPSTENRTAGGLIDELYLHSYIKDAEQYSYALTRLKKAVGEIISLATNDLSLNIKT